VARALTPEERAAQAEALAAQESNQADRARQEEQDQRLLRLYRSPEEVIGRRDSTVEELDAQITALTGLLEGAERRVADMQSQADVAGEQASDVLLGQLEDASEERDRLDRKISHIQTEKEETVATAQKKIDRLRERLNLN